MKIIVLLGSLIFGPIDIEPGKAMQDACLDAIRAIQKYYPYRAGEFECRLATEEEIKNEKAKPR